MPRDAGRGFAVVADEIRKLSEVSTKSSRDISQSIKLVVAKIDEATRANAGTGLAFSAIDEKIKEVSRSMIEVNAIIGEISIGSKRVLDAMVELKKRSLEVRDGSMSMDEGSMEINSAVAELSERVGGMSAQLDEDVNRFRTHCGDLEAEDVSSKEDPGA